MMVNVAAYLVYTQLTGSTVLLEYPKLTTMAYGGQFLQAALRTQVASVLHENFTPYRRTTFVAWSLMAINASYLVVTGSPLFNEFWMFAAVNAIIWSAIAHFVFYVIQDFKRILDINVFTIKPKNAAMTSKVKEPSSPDALKSRRKPTLKRKK